MTAGNTNQDFNWWLGQVVNVMDPHQSGRVQVRVFGQHDDTTNIPDSALPWALPIQPVTSAAAGRIGSAPVGLVKGSKVIGYWADVYKQLPIIIGTIGKSGDLIPGQIINGAPAINTDGGSIPPAANGNPSNSRSALNPNVIPLSTIDSQGANTSVSANTGVVVTSLVENGMYNAKTPTTAFADKTDKSDVIQIILTVDPFNKNSSNPCFVIAFNSIDLMALARGIIGGLVGALKQAVIGAVVNGILTLMKKFGVAKILGILNEAALAIQEVGDLLSILQNSSCFPDIFNQGFFDPINGLMAESLNAINTITSTIANIPAEAASITGNLFDNIVTAPIASVATDSTPVPPTISINPPPNFVQQYSSSDPYPGYINFVDPTGATPPVYIPRNGEPNFTSAAQAVFFNAQETLLNSIEPHILAGGLNASALTSIFSSVASSSQIFAAKKVIGEGFAIASAAVSLASVIPSLSSNLTDVFSTQLPEIPGINDIENAISNHTVLQLGLARRRIAAMASVGGA